MTGQTEPSNDICFMPATEMAHSIRKRQLSAVEVMQAHLARIDQLNGSLNAIVTLLPEQAMAAAKQADDAVARGDELGLLHGLPIAHKDALLTAGIRTTFGSPIFEDFVPQTDDLIVERLSKAGAITIGKTNLPEFGAGSQTFNPVFGATLNPYDTTKTCGGSSGGSAVALACGMHPIADGSDMGGSLRNPASFCNVVGLRPSPGRVPAWPSTVGWSPIGVQGPMARTVQDVALLLRVMAGPDPRSPIAITESGELFARPLQRDFRDVRIAWCGNLGGLPFDPRVQEVVEQQRNVFQSLGCVLVDETPDLRDADEIFRVWRAWLFEVGYGHLLKQHRDQLKDTLIWNIEEGTKLTGTQIGQAEKKRTELYHRVREFMRDIDFLVLPVSQVPPFDVTQPYITEIDGVKLDTYIDWMRSCYYITVTGLPAISVPAGFTSEGLPVGIQLVGRHQDDWGVLQLAHAFEQATGHGTKRPTLNLSPDIAKSHSTRTR